MKCYSRKVFAYFLLAVFLSALFGCSHKEVLSPDAKLSYNKSVQDLYLRWSFGFSYEGHDYNFVSAKTEGYLYDCQRFDGYKDDKLTYSFTGQQTRQITAIYQADTGIDQKFKRAVTLIDSLSPRVYTCEAKPLEPNTIGYKVGKALGIGTEILVYGTMAVLVSPILVPTMIRDTTTERDMQKALEKIRLGDSYEKINNILDYKSKEETSSGYLIQSFSSYSSTHVPTRLLFVYKDKKLVAYVWGIEPS